MEKRKMELPLWNMVPFGQMNTSISCPKHTEEEQVCFS